MVAKTPEGISLENLSKRASVYIDPDCDLYLELQYLQSSRLTKCACFDIHLLTSKGRILCNSHYSTVNSVYITKFV